MARAVAEIDGDSSGLVGALDQGKKGMEKLEAEGKKLSDQLREVTDSADKAAGALVNKIGGPKAITAIAGAGAAFGAAKMGVDFFLNSVEKLFKSMGDEGMKVWDGVEKALDSITGAFAKAVIGGGSAEDMGKKLITVFSGLAKIVEALVTYGFPMLNIGFEALVKVMGTLNELTGKGVENFDALKRSQDNYANATSVTNIENLTKAYDELAKKVQGLVGDQTALAMAANDQAIAENRAFQASAKKVGDIIRDVEIRKEVEKSRAVLVAQVKSEVDNIDFSYAGMGWKIERDREMAERLQTKTSELYSSLAKQFAAQGKDAYSFMPEALKLAYDSAAADLSLLEERGEQLYDQYLGKGPAAPPKTSTGGGGSKGPTVDPVAEAIKAAASSGSRALAEAQEKFAADVQRTKDAAQGFFTGFNPSEGWVDSWRTAVDGVKEVYAGLVSAVTSGNEEIKSSNDDVQSQRSELFDTYIAQNAKMVAISLAAGESMADAGRAAVGAVISALGDKAMALASIEFWTGNLAAAAGLTAAGMAAYATAAILGSNQKKATSATKATAKEAPVTNNQTNYNLRVDAAFADEEGIARAFAKAQRLANTRYLGSAAY